MNCNLCPRNCGANRTPTENNGGFCGMPLSPVVAKAQLHFWEEPIISGKNGSGTVFFSGCSLACVYCQNYEISKKRNGRLITDVELAEIFKDLESKGAHNINLVNPTHYALSIKNALDIYRPKIPIVYNTGGYENIITLNMLKDYIDIYLFDLKYLSPERAERYSGEKNYPEIATNAILNAVANKPNNIIKNGIMQEGVIIRHLLLPQGTREAMAVFDWVKANTPNVYFSLMSQYLPLGEAENYKEINRRITKREHQKLMDYLCDSDFKNIFTQELSSANKKFIPEFDWR